MVERRRLLATAGALSATAFATTVCLGANFGLFGLTQPDSPVGRLDVRRPVAAAVRVAPPTTVITAPPRAPRADD
jgi:hypothetical protein